MNRHQVLTGALNPGDSCFAVGYVEGIPFTAYASGCDLVILASNFHRVQIIPGDNHGNIQVGCIDCSSENGKIAASYANQVYIFEPTPSPVQKKRSHKLDYQWHQTGSFKIESLISNLSWNHDGSRLLTGSDSIQLWACGEADSPQNNRPSSNGVEAAAAAATTATSTAATSTTLTTQLSSPTNCWDCVWQCKTATPVYHLKFSPDGQFFASAGKADRLVKIWYSTRRPVFTVTSPGEKHEEIIETKGEHYSFVYIAHPRAVTGFSWRRTSKYMPRGSVANVMVTSCRDNICRLWAETVLPDSGMIDTNTKHASTADKKKEMIRQKSKPHFTVGMKSRKRKPSEGHITALQDRSASTHQHSNMASMLEGHQTNGHKALPLHFHIAATINPNTDIPLLPAIGTMSKGNAPNFVVNWLNNKELQYTLAAETLLQTGKPDSDTDFEDQESISDDSDSEAERTTTDGDLQESSETSQTLSTTQEEETKPAESLSVPSGRLTPPEILKLDEEEAPSDTANNKPLKRPTTLGSIPSEQITSFSRMTNTPMQRLQKKFDNLMREWHQSPDMMYSIHPIDGSFLLWLVDWIDEHIPGVHRQPQVSFSCRIPHAFPIHDATSLCSNLVLYRSNLTIDPRAANRRPEAPTFKRENRGMTPSFSFSQRLGQVPAGVNIYAFTPRVSMLSKHSNGTLNQWEISFSEKSKFQTVLNVAHVQRCCGHRFQLNDLQCHPVLPLLLTTSHHNIPKVEVDPEIVAGRNRRVSVAARRTSVALGIGTANTPSPGARRSSSINLFGKSLLSESEHQKLSTLFNSAMEGTHPDDKEKEEIIIPDAIMEKLNTEMNWPDMSAPTGLCSELILWRVFPVGPLSKSGGVSELSRINSPFISAFAHIAWLPGLLPSSCLGSVSNSPSACFVASDGYSLRLFQAVIDARSLLMEVQPNTDQLEGYLSSSSPLTQYIHPEPEEAPPEGRPNIISLQSTSRPGCIIELDVLSSAKQSWQNVQLMHVFQQHFITGKKSQSPFSVNTADPSAKPPTGFGEKFYLVVMERNDHGQSVMHMWYIQLETQVTTSPAPRETRENEESEVVADSSPESSEAESQMQYEPPQNVPQVTTKLKTYSRKVCMQKLELPPGVEVISATPAAGHLSSSTIYPACNAPYLISTACSDGKLRFWQCEVAEGGVNVCLMDEMEPDMASSESGTFEDDDELFVDKECALASYKWDEWKLLIHEDTSSAVNVPGRPIALSCAYNGRIASVYRPESCAPSRSKVPLQVIIVECESTGGSEWMIEDKLDLGILDLDYIRNGAAGGALGSLEAESINYKIMKRSSKVEDFLDIQEYSVESPSALDLANPHVKHPAVTNSVLSPTKRPRTLPVQIAWVSKEDGSHILTIGMGMKVTIFAPVYGNRAGVDNVHEVTGETCLYVPPTLGSPLLAKEETKPKWAALVTINLTTVDGIPPHSKMLSWVRAGILVVGLANEMHVYTQWKQEEISMASRKLNNKLSGKEEVNRKEEDGLSVNLLTVPMTKSDREQSVTDMSALVKNDDLDDIGDDEDVSFDPGLFDRSYKACPVLPQYHPKQLTELMNCGKFRRVKAILSHLVRCIAGESAVKRAVVGDGEEEQAETTTSSSLSRALSLSTSPAEGGIDEADTKLDYIELASIPPLPLYALLNADKETPKAVVAQETSKRKRAPTITRAGTITQPPEEASQDYTSLFSTSVDYNLSTSPTFDVNADLSPRDNMMSVIHKLSDPTYFGVAQARLLTNYLTHMHLPGLTSLDQMHLLALADTVASTKTEVTTHSSGVTGTLVGRDGAGYAASSGTPDATHAGETLDECGLRYLLAMRFHMCLLRSMPPWQQVQLIKDGLATSNFAWAFHSEAEEELLLLIPGMQAGQPSWKELRAMGIGWWVRNNATLKRCMEKVAKAQFRKDTNPLDAALFYLSMKKKTLLWGLFRSVQDTKMTTFFGNDFNKDRWRKAALKNAFSLLGRQRFEHAAAFFLLAGSLKDAIEILVNKLHDLQLAMVVTRLYEEELEMPLSHKELLCQHILACDTDMNRIDGLLPSGDPFLRSIAYWMLKDYPQALETLLKKPLNDKKVETDNDRPKDLDVDQSGNPDVFNFYNYLRTHPLLVRRQMLDQENIGQGTAVLISQGGKGDLGFKDEITPVERRLFFATAHAHAAAGCPLLTLEVLSKLPRVKTNGDNSPKDLKRAPNGSSSVDSGMIMSGTIDGGMSNSANGPSKESSNGFDWGQPISESKVESKDSALDFDWSQPVGPKDEDELDLKWSDDEPTSEDEDAKIRTNGEVNHNGSTTFSDKTDSSDEETEREKGVNPAMTEGQPIDIMAQQLKFTACLKIMMEELRTLATGFEVDGGQLRFQLYVWLEHEVETLRTVCNYGIGKSLADIRDKIDGQGSLGESEEIIKSPALHEIIQARRIDLEEKRQRATRRKNWLRSHHHLLRTLFSYAVLYGLNGGGLCSVTMELVLLVQELQQERLQQQLSSPLPLPTTLPLLSASIANCKTVVADPILHLRHFTHDILKSILDFTAPPSANRLVSKVNTLQRLSVALSACIYQTLCDSDSFSMAAGTSKFAGMDVYDGRNLMYKLGSLVGMNRRRRMHSSGETAATVTSLPSKWPGVSTLQALLASERDEDTPNPNIQLCEGLFSVYISFLVRALSTSNCSELFRLVAHPLDGKMWASVFGGGAKVVDKAHSQSGGANPPSTEQHDASKQRNRYMLRLMGKASSGRNPTTQAAEEKPTHRELFVAPETSIMDYFMVKPYIDIEGIDYDSNNSDSSDDDLDEYDDDDMYDDIGPFSMKKKTKVPLPGEAEHSDPNSYSWCLMRYVILKLVVHKIQGFLPLSGIELAELPVVSPNLHSVLKLLEQWQQGIVRKLDLFAGPPQDFIPGCSTEVPSTITGPALLRYKGLLDPINTPFRSSHKSAKPAKRLWNYLVRQEPVQEIFINYIFHRKPGLQDQSKKPQVEAKVESKEKDVDVTLGGQTVTDGMKSQCRIIHKEQEKIPSFCFNQANPTGIIVSSQRGLLELDISMLLNPNNSMWVEEDIDDASNTKTRGATMIEDDFLLVNPRERTLSHPYPGITPTPSMISSGFGGGEFLADQTGRGTNIITRRPLYHIRRLASHPSLPYYLSGSNDGSVHMWEWGHSQKLYTHRHHGQFQKVTQIHFNDQGNKFGVCDDSGLLSLWQVGMNTPAVTRPYWSKPVHNKAVYDFSFLGSSSFLATAGFSSENKNVCLWDTLMHPKSCMVHAFSCHEGGCPCLTYCPRQKILISGNKKGEVSIYDVRQRKLRHSFQAHESGIKCLAVDPSEEFFATGSAEGNIKVWCLSVHSLLHFFPGQHSRGTFFRHSGNGVLQLAIMPSNHLYSCGADGTMKWRLLPEWDSIL